MYAVDDRSVCVCVCVCVCENTHGMGHRSVGCGAVDDCVSVNECICVWAHMRGVAGEVVKSDLCKSGLLNN